MQGVRLRERIHQHRERHRGQVTGGVVVVGAGLAGATAGTSLRELGFDGPITLVGAEPVLPYERPGLSKGYLAGSTSADDLTVHGPEVYERFGIDVRLGAEAVALDTDAHRLSLADGTTLPYDDVVIATGSVNRRPPLPGMELRGVHQLRTIAEASALRSAASTARTAVVVGQGFVGCEVAATLRSLGLDVTMVDPLPGPLWSLGAELSARVAQWHTGAGVRLRNDVGVASLDGASAVTSVTLADGAVLPADLVVVGVGALPATDWVSGVELVDGAVAVDADGRSSAPHVWAIGDAAAAWDEQTGSHRRVEHFDSAIVQGQRVAHALVGAPSPAGGRSWFWTDQHGHTLMHGGVHGPEDDLVWRGEAVAFWLRDGEVTAVAGIDAGRDFRRAMKIIGTRPATADLQDDALDLRAVSAAG